MSMINEIGKIVERIICITKVREFDFDGFKIKVQFNSGRIVSSAAKVDKKSIEARPCFLCEANRPAVQRGINFKDYSILVNPFPIFPEH